MRMNQGFVEKMQCPWGNKCVTRLIAAIPEAIFLAKFSIRLPQVRLASGSTPTYQNITLFQKVRQSAFRSIPSTVTALLEAIGSWAFDTDRGIVNAVVFADFKKAFDTVDHTILLSKLTAYGIQENVYIQLV